MQRQQLRLHIKRKPDRLVAGLAPRDGVVGDLHGLRDPLSGFMPAAISSFASIT